MVMTKRTRQGEAHQCSFVLASQVVGRILYIHPTTKLISLSLLPGILGCVQPDGVPFAGLAIGDFVEDAKVMFVDQDRGVFFRLQGCSALARVRQLTEVLCSG